MKYGYQKKKIQQYSKVPKSHGMAVKKIAAMTGLTPYQVQGIIQSFFGKYGLKYFISRGMPVKVNGLGIFYFHKKTEQSKRKKRN